MWQEKEEGVKPHPLSIQRFLKGYVRLGLQVQLFIVFNVAHFVEVKAANMRTRGGGGKERLGLHLMAFSLTGI